jgi:hypothetical protein
VDDVLIMARTKQTLIDTFLKLKNEALKYGPIIFIKTKYLKCTRKQTLDGKLSVESMQFGQVESFKYLGSIVNKNNTIEEEIKERIMAGNEAFYANKRMFQGKLLSKRSKLKLYWSVIIPVVTYACETWVLKENVIQKLMIFERKVLRKIFGPTKQQNGLWRIKTNEELDKLIKHKNIIRFVKAQRLNWLGHIERMSEERVVKKINNWKPIAS